MPTMKQQLQEKLAAGTLAVSPAKSPVTDELKKRATEAKAKVTEIFTPSQVIGTFTEALPKDQSSKLKSLYDDLLSEFANEAQSRVEIGSTLISIRELLGENFGKFLADCVVKALRKSLPTCYRYIALASAFNHKFAKNKVFKTALSRIWGGEGCFDSVNGELKPAVDEAIGAIGGIPESTDSAVCEVAAQKFVDAVDKLVSNSRSAIPGGRKWDAETMTKKHVGVVKGFRAFITNKSVSANRAIKLLTALLVDAMVEMSANDIKTAFDAATKQISERKMEVKKAHDEIAETVAVA
jgi:hypothetical protein